MNSAPLSCQLIHYIQLNRKSQRDFPILSNENRGFSNKNTLESAIIYGKNTQAFSFRAHSRSQSVSLSYEFSLFRFVSPICTARISHIVSLTDDPVIQRGLFRGFLITNFGFPMVLFQRSFLTLIASAFRFKHAFIKILSILKKTLAISEMCAIINKR